MFQKFCEIKISESYQRWLFRAKMHNGGSNGAGMKVAGTFGDVLVQVQGEAAELLRGAVGEGGGAAVRDPEEGGAALSSKEDEGTIRGLDEAKVAPVLGGGGDQLEGTEGVKKDNLNSQRWTEMVKKCSFAISVRMSLISRAKLRGI